MTTNPYKDQPGNEAYANAWDLGHGYGQQHPTEQNPTPPGFYPPWDLDAQGIAWMNQVWSEGALAGQGDIAPNIGVPHASHNAVSTAGHVAEGGMAAYDIGHGVVRIYDEERGKFLCVNA